MSNVKISGLTAYTNPAVSDVLPIVDLLNDQTKKITISDLLKNGFGPGTVALPSFGFIGDPDTGIYSPGANQFAVTTGGTQRLLIDASGNTTIQGDLTVNGTTTTVSSNTLSIKDKNIEIAVVSTPTDTTADGGGITLKGATDKTLTWVDSTDCWTFNQGLNLTAGTAGAPALVFNGDVNSGLFQPGADSLAIATGGTQRVTVDSSGRLLLGTTTEGQVSADDLTIASSGSTGITIRSGTSNSGNLFFSDGTSGDDEIRGYVQYFHASNSLLFGSNAQERMRITSAGLVGIGTSSPGGPLEVQTASGERIIFDSAGASQQPRIQLNRDGGTDYSIQNSIGAFEILKGSDDIYRYTGDVHQFHTAGSGERMRIDSSGNVGIGTSSPEGVLSIYGTAAEPPTSGTTSNSLIELSSSLGNRLNIGLNTVTGDYGAYIQVNDNNLAVAPYPLNLQPNGGNILIGTTTAGFASYGDALTIERVTHCGMTLRGGTTSDTEIFFADGTTGTARYAGGIRYAHNTDHMQFTVNANERMRIDSSGNVGIGVTSLATSSRLTLLESAGNGQTLEIKGANTGGAGSQPGIKFTASTGDNIGGIFGDTNSDSVILQSGGTERMRIDSSGNVYIGGTSDANADFVFDSGSRASFYRTLLIAGATSSAATIALNTNGSATFAGTVTANAFSGDGSALTNLPASGGGGGVSLGLAIALG